MENKEKFYQRQWFIWLLLILLPPVGIIFMWVTKKEFKTSKKVILTIGADWNEQAALKAEQYMDYSSFSKSGLIDQVEFEGFTTEQAEYGAAAVGY